MSALLTADWFQLDSYYRKFDIYNMSWAMDEGLDNMIVTGAPYGGPIAVVRDRKQFVRIATTTKPVITIYNCAGNVISKILWNSGVLSTWAGQMESSSCVFRRVETSLIYDMFGAYQKTFNMGQEVRDTKVTKAQLFPNPFGVGLAVMTSTNRMFLLSNIAEPKIRPVPDLPRASEPITCWCVLSTGLRSSAVIGFLVCRDKEIYKCQLGESRAIPLVDISYYLSI
ncbi:vacuolar protein sorting-associated protein 16 homolog [Choristoneura fumiferana]|uniref:vacuolar protein sorting-associated protein 16 homolog n=1 Tax=Choristoneura fumiferana TaxID=7141 RepID=UPI003D15A2F0